MSRFNFFLIGLWICSSGSGRPGYSSPDVTSIEKGKSLRICILLPSGLCEAGYSNDKGDVGRKLEKAIVDLRSYADVVEQVRGPDFMDVHYFIKIQRNGKVIETPSMPVSLRYVADRLYSLKF